MSTNETKCFTRNRERPRHAERINNDPRLAAPSVPIIAVPGLVSLPLWFSPAVPRRGEDVYNRSIPWDLKVEALLADLRVRLYRRDSSHYDEPCGCWLVDTEIGPVVVRRYLKPSAISWRVMSANGDLLPRVLEAMK